MPERRRVFPGLGLSLVGWRLALPVLRRTMPLERLLRLTASPRDRDRDLERETFAIRVAGRLWRQSESPCLERSVALHRLLGRAGARPELVLGLAPDKSGHAWVELDGAAVLETGDPRARYVELVAFNASGAHAAAREATP